MKFHNSFSVEVIAKEFTIYNIGSEGKSIIMNLELTLEDAENFINRFAGAAFMFGDYKVLYKFNNDNEPVMITMFKDENVYIIQSANGFINEVMRGYRTLLAVDAIIDITSFDFKAAIDLQEPRDSAEDSTDEETKPEFKTVDDEGDRFTAYE